MKEMTLEKFTEIFKNCKQNGQRIADVKIKKMYQELRKKNCFYCGKDNPSILGVFNPYDPDKFGGVKGKNRIIFYTVCESHLSENGFSDKIEKALEYYQP